MKVKCFANPLKRTRRVLAKAQKLSMSLIIVLTGNLLLPCCTLKCLIPQVDQSIIVAPAVRVDNTSEFSPTTNYALERGL